MAGSANGGLDTGTNTANAWYFVFAIKRLDAGNVDILHSLSPTTPTMPSNYTKKRRVDLFLHAANNTLIAFIQKGDTFLWYVPVLDYSATPETNS